MGKPWSILDPANCWGQGTTPGLGCGGWGGEGSGPYFWFYKVGRYGLYSINLLLTYFLGSTHLIIKLQFNKRGVSYTFKVAMFESEIAHECV